MYRILYICLVLITVLFQTGCQKFDEIDERFEQLEQRVSSLEDATKALQDAINAGALITKVEIRQIYTFLMSAFLESISSEK